MGRVQPYTTAVMNLAFKVARALHGARARSTAPQRLAFLPRSLRQACSAGAESEEARGCSRRLAAAQGGLQLLLGMLESEPDGRGHAEHV